jgi:hypothetical protein
MTESAAAQPDIDDGDGSLGAGPAVRESRSPRFAARGASVEHARSDISRREDRPAPHHIHRGRGETKRGEYGVDDQGRDGSVVGFGAETPAFLLRAAPIAPLRKAAASED